MYYYWGKDPAMTFGTALPFGFNSRQMNAWLRFGGGNELLNELLKNFNCIGIAAGNTGAQEHIVSRGLPPAPPTAARPREERPFVQHAGRRATLGSQHFDRMLALHSPASTAGI
jgi:hypothetical protein